MSPVERTGWRDEDISQRHRRWGFNCPAVDIDFLVTEYNFGRPMALIEYKEMSNYEGDDIKLLHPTYKALADLANNYSQTSAEGITRRTPLPFLIVRYSKDPHWWFRVKPVNEAAIKDSPTGTDDWFNLTEREFVSGLYHMRQMKLTEHTDLEALDDVAVWQSQPPATLHA